MHTDTQNNYFNLDFYVMFLLPHFEHLYHVVMPLFLSLKSYLHVLL